MTLNFNAFSAQTKPTLPSVYAHQKSKWTVAFGVGRVPYPDTLQVNFCSPIQEEGYCTILLVFNGAIFEHEGLCI